MKLTQMMATSKWLKPICILGVVLLSFTLNCVQAQDAWPYDVKYDFYRLGWTGLSNDDFNDDASLSAFSRILYDALPTSERRQVDIANFFLPHYLKKATAKHLPLSSYTLLNFVVRDSQVMTLHSFFLDNNNRICQYWTRIGKGNSGDFKSICENMKDSIQKYISNKNFASNQQGGVQQILKSCLLPYEKAFRSELAIQQSNDTLLAFKKFDIETVMLAIGHYLKFNNARYFHDFVTDMDNVQNRKKKAKFVKKYAHIWAMINALSHFHNTKEYIKAATKNKSKQSEYLEKADKSKERFIDCKTELPNNPLDKTNRPDEYEIWQKYEKKYQLDSLENKLEIAARLISNCQVFLAAAQNAERAEKWAEARNIYMELLRNEDVIDILRQLSPVVNQANCGDLKVIANQKLDTLLKQVQKIYLTNIQNADKELLKASRWRDTLAIIEQYQQASLLNNDLSGLATLKIQDLFLKIGDGRIDCSEVDIADFYYKRGLLLSDNDKMKQAFRERLHRVEKRRRTCLNDMTPLPPQLPDTLIIEINQKSTPKDKVIFIEHIVRIFNKMMNNDEGEMPLEGHAIKIEVSGNDVSFLLTSNFEQVSGTFSDMNFPNGESVGNEYRAQLIANKSAQFIKDVLKEFSTIIDTTRIELIGVADNATFENRCVRDGWKYREELKKVPIIDFNKFADPKKRKPFAKLECSNDDNDKNLLLAYLRAYRHKKLIAEKLPKYIPIIYNLCGRVYSQRGSQYRGVVSKTTFKLKESFVYKKKIN